MGHAPSHPGAKGIKFTGIDIFGFYAYAIQHAEPCFFRNYYFLMLQETADLIP